MAFLEIDHVTKFFPATDGPGQVCVFRDVSFGLEAGEFLTMVGHSGCGKSTLLNIIAGLERASAGGIVLEGREIARPGIDRMVVFQNFSLMPWMTVAENIGLAVRAAHPGWSRREVTDYVQRYVDMVGLGGAESKRPAALSGGMRRRVALAQSLLGDPGLLMLDEPTAGLDPEQRLRFRELASELGDGRIVLVSTHQTEDVAALCQRVIVLRDGQVAFDGTPAQLSELAAGRVWIADGRDARAQLWWRTAEGRHRHVGDPPIGAQLVDPTIEDGYLLLAGPAAAPEEVAA